MAYRYQNRTEAGQLLADHLEVFIGGKDAVVLGLPRGGVPVAYEVAQALHLPLDVMIVRKLGTPGHEEMAMGAIASGGVRVMNDDVVSGLHISQQDIAAVERDERQELERRERRYREGRPPLALEGRTVVLVDDGLATGATMHAAVRAVRQFHPARVVVAVPVASREAYRLISGAADSVHCLQTPEKFHGVGLWYEDFEQTTDNEVRALLQRAG